MKISSRQVTLLCILAALFAVILVIRDLVPCNPFRMSGMDSMMLGVLLTFAPAAILLILPIAGVAIALLVGVMYGISRFWRSINWNNSADVRTDLILFFIIVAIIFGGVFIPRSSCKVQSTAAQLSNTQFSNLVYGWNIYTNKSLRFSIQYPDDLKPSIELNDKNNRLTGFGALPVKYFEVRLEKDDNPNMGVNFGYLDTAIQSKDVILGDAHWYMAVSATGYGDAGRQGSPFVDFGARYGGDVYHVIFYGDAEVSKEEWTILASFRFHK